MNSRSVLFSGMWIATCAAAFFAGRTTDSSTSPVVDDKDSPGTTASNRGNSQSASSQVRRRATLRSGGMASSANRSDRIREQAKALKAMSDPLERAQGFLDFVQNLAPNEFLNAVDAFREGGIEDDQFGEYRLMLAAWAQVDPNGALNYASENTGTPFARQTILAAWAKNDAASAIEWARNNFENTGDENRANPWLVGVIEGLASVDTGSATQLLEELPFSRERGEALNAIYREISALGTDTAKAWVANLTDERLQAGAAARLASTLARENPQEATEWAASMGPEVMSRATGEIIDQWAESDLTAARSWVEGQPEEIVAAAAPRLIGEMIEQQDISTASNWLSNYEGNPEFDDAIRSFVYDSIRQEPTMAADWIMRMTNERDRTGTFHRILGRWMEQDRAGAMDYINSNEVPESIRRRANMSGEQR